MHFGSELPAEGNDHNDHGHDIPEPHTGPSYFEASGPEETGLYATDASALDAVPEHEVDSTPAEAAPESAAAATRAECISDINTLLDAAIADGPEGTAPLYTVEDVKTTREIQVVREMITEAARDRDAATVASYTQKLQAMPHVRPEDLAEAHFAGAVMGDEAATAAIHEALEAEQIKEMLRRENKRLGGLDPETGPEDEAVKEVAKIVNNVVSGVFQAIFAGPDGVPPDWHSGRALPESLHHTIIKRCAEYDVPAAGWIDTYALDDQDQWEKTDYYLAQRMQVAAETGVDTTAMQHDYEANAAHLLSAPEGYITQHLPRMLEQVKDPQIRTALMDEYITQTNDKPMTPELFKGRMQIAAAIYDHARQNNGHAATPAQAQFGRTCGDDIERVRVDKTYPCTEYIKDVYPFSRAEMQYKGYSAGQVVETVDTWYRIVIGHYQATPSRDHLENDEMHRRDSRLREYANYFAEQGDFASAQQVLSAIAPSRDARAYGREHLLRIASEPAHLEPFREEDVTQILDVPFDASLEVAELRVAGNTGELAERAVAHLEAVVDEKDDGMHKIFVPDDQKRPGSDFARIITNGQHFEYAEGAFRAVKAVDPEAAVTMARRVLPVLRNLQRRDYSLTKEMSDTLIAAGDPEEPRNALADTLDLRARDPFKHVAVDRPRTIEALWNLAQRIKRAERNGRAQ